MISKDLGTTILGCIIAMSLAAMPVVDMAQGDWSAYNIFALVGAVATAFFGYFTNKADKA